MAKKDDLTDTLLKRWAKRRRQIIGITPMDTDPRDSTKGGWCDAREYLGAVRCTLSAVKDYHDGAGSSSTVHQFFPEVYTDEDIVVNKAFKNLKHEHKVIVDAHYCAWGPVKIKIDYFDITWNDYWNRLREAKVAIDLVVRMNVATN